MTPVAVETRTVVKYRGYILQGYTVLTGPNSKDSTLMDAVVLFTDIGLMAVDPKIAEAALKALVNELPPHATANHLF